MRAIFSDEKQSPSQPKHGLPPQSPTNPWHILVVDDEPDVHEVSQLVLGRLSIFERPVKLYNVYSRIEAQHILQKNPTLFCVALVDVVMDTSHDGLELVNWIRTQLKNTTIRIILRTGQPGIAPIHQVIHQYDINDYRHKSDLTAQNLIACLYTAVRSYKDTLTISQNLQNYRILANTTCYLIQQQEFDSIIQKTYQCLSNLLGNLPVTLYIVQQPFTREPNPPFDERLQLFKRSGHSDTIEHCYTLSSLTQQEQTDIMQIVNSPEFIITRYKIGYKTTTSMDQNLAIMIQCQHDIPNTIIDILRLLCTQVLLILKNLSQQQQVEATQEELLYIASTAIQARNLEGSQHMHRIALYCEVFAQQLQKPKHFIRSIKMAAPLYQIGKITLPESLLHKAEPLTKDERHLFESYTSSGADILMQSKLDIAPLAANIAHWHREHWDGSGFPDGLEKEQIPLEARIMTLADTFDALAQTNNYKQNWSDSDIYDFISSHSGTRFDPMLVSIFQKNLEKFIDIRNRYPN